MRTEKIVLVEDETIVRLDIEAKLKMLGHDVVGSCSTAEEALALIALHTPDLVLLDIVLDGPIDGIQAGKIIHDKFNLPIIFITAYADGETITRVREIGPIEFLVKPFDTKDLWITIDLQLDRARTDALLRQSEERYRRLLEAITDYVFHVAIVNGRVERTEHSPSCFSVTKYTAEEFQNDQMLWFRMVDDKDRETVLSHADRIIRFHDFRPIEHRIARKDGVIRWIQNLQVPHFDQTGVLTGYDGVISDITARKNAEEALQQSEEKFRTIADFTSDWEFWMTPDRKYNYMSPSCFAVTGYNAEEFYANPSLLLDIVHPKERDLLIRHLNETREQFHPADLMEFRIICRDGSEKWIEHKCKAITDFQGRWLGTRGSNRDVSVRKKIEKELFEKDQILELSAAIAKLGNWILFPDNQTITVSDHMYKLLGFGQDEQIRDLKNFYSIIFQEDRNMVSASMQRAVRETVSFDIQFRFLRKDGVLRFARTIGRKIESQKENPLRWICTFQDITESKIIEDSLRRANDYNRNILETTLEPMVIINETGKISDTNAATEFITGYSREMILGKDFSFYFTNPEEARKGYEKAFEEGIVRDFPLDVRHVDGRQIPVLYNATVLRSESGKVIGVLASARDITQIRLHQTERENLIAELQKAAMNIKMLSGLIPICSSCKKIRDDKGFWTQLEKYISEHSDVMLSHSICPDCSKKLYPDLYDAKGNRKRKKPNG